MDILITGSNGMLANSLIDVLSKEHNLISKNSSELDISNLDKVLDSASNHNPDLIINAAAYTDVDKAENDFDNAYNVNALGSRNLAIASNEYNCPLLHISTDYVFNGEGKSPYREYDKTEPLGVYGKTKFIGEQFIQNLTNEYYIIRTAWLYGHKGNNFVETMLKLSESHDEVAVVNDQIGSPTFTKDLAIAISKLIKNPNYGLYHLTNSGQCSWYDFAKDIFEIMEIDTVINPVSSGEFQRPAPRPHYSVLDNYNWKLLGFQELRNYKDALNFYLKIR